MWPWPRLYNVDIMEEVKEFGRGVGFIIRLVTDPRREMEDKKKGASLTSLEA